MLREQFHFDLPKEQIAQRPAIPRDSSRLLHLNRTTGEMRDEVFRDILQYLHPGDLLVVNDSKVMPARLLGIKADTGAAVEVLLLRDAGNKRWECLVKPGRRLKPGASVIFGNGILTGTVDGEVADGNRIVRFAYDESRSFFDILNEIGLMPLPHYITAPIEDKAEYQTVYAEIEGSAAAPTAGFHFTQPLIEAIRQKGIEIARVTLHVGLGTFRPVKEQEIEKHLMHREWYYIGGDTAALIARTKQNGGRVIAVGTTTCRTLEACARDHGAVVPCEDSTDIFIYPDYKFSVIDALITNFHLPESTLIMLVSAFAGYETTMNAYRHAVESGYRFFSFGDAMFIE